MLFIIKNTKITNSASIRFYLIVAYFQRWQRFLFDGSSLFASDCSAAIYARDSADAIYVRDGTADYASDCSAVHQSNSTAVPAFNGGAALVLVTVCGGILAAWNFVEGQACIIASVVFKEWTPPYSAHFVFGASVKHLTAVRIRVRIMASSFIFAKRIYK